MSNSAYQYYKDLPGWAKGTVIVGGALIGFFVGKSIWDTVKKALAPPPVNLKEAKDAVSTLNALASQGQTPTQTDAQFQGYVSTLVTSMSGCFQSFVNVQTVFSNLNNNADLYKLIAVFGTQTVNECLWGSDTYSLSEALNARLNSAQVANINSILATKGISYSF